MPRIVLAPTVPTETLPMHYPGQVSVTALAARLRALDVEVTVTPPLAAAPEDRPVDREALRTLMTALPGADAVIFFDSGVLTRGDQRAYPTHALRQLAATGGLPAVRLHAGPTHGAFRRGPLATTYVYGPLLLATLGDALGIPDLITAGYGTPSPEASRDDARAGLRPEVLTTVGLLRTPERAQRHWTVLQSGQWSGGDPSLATPAHAAAAPAGATRLAATEDLLTFLDTVPSARLRESGALLQALGAPLDTPAGPLGPAIRRAQRQLTSAAHGGLTLAGLAEALAGTVGYQHRYNLLHAELDADLPGWPTHTLASIAILLAHRADDLPPALPPALLALQALGRDALPLIRATTLRLVESDARAALEGSFPNAMRDLRVATYDNRRLDYLHPALAPRPALQALPNALDPVLALVAEGRGPNGQRHWSRWIAMESLGDLALAQVGGELVMDALLAARLETAWYGALFAEAARDMLRHGVHDNADAARWAGYVQRVTRRALLHSILARAIVDVAIWHPAMAQAVTHYHRVGGREGVIDHLVARLPVTPAGNAALTEALEMAVARGALGSPGDQRRLADLLARRAHRSAVLGVAPFVHPRLPDAPRRGRLRG